MNNKLFEYTLRIADDSLILGQRLAYEGDFGGTSGSLWGHFEHIDVEFHV